MKRKGFFLTLEGPDGCGKTTQSKLLAKFLRKKKFKVLHTREPGGTSFAESLRRILLDPKFEILPLTELLLYEASRAQHTDEVLRPAVKQGKFVICERYTDATCAYQGYGRKLDLSIIKKLNQIATGGLVPDLTIVLDVPAELGLRRAGHHKLDRLEQEKISFHRRVRGGYFKLARQNPKRIKIVPSQGPVNEVHQKVCQAVFGSLKRFQAS